MTNTQALTIPYSETHRLKSKINNFEYELFVALPANYHSKQNSYPVIFTTDPNFIFPILLGATKSLDSLIPHAIIIGIGHANFDFKELDKKTHDRNRDINRARDFLPWNLMTQENSEFTKYFPNIDSELTEAMIKYSGHASDFIDFIKSEVLPFVDKTYRTTSKRTLIGHSFGGVLASWIMIHHPQIFQNYLIISPILILQNYAMFTEISHISKTLAARIYLCAGSLEASYSSNKNFLIDLEKFQQQLSLSPNITAKVEIFEDEYHASVVPFGISKGLRFIYPKNQ